VEQVRAERGERRPPVGGTGARGDQRAGERGGQQAVAPRALSEPGGVVRSRRAGGDHVVDVDDHGGGDGSGQHAPRRSKRERGDDGRGDRCVLERIAVDPEGREAAPLGSPAQHDGDHTGPDDRRASMRQTGLVPSFEARRTR